MKERRIYDLDGTLSSLNNTFDFIFGYYGYSKRVVRGFLLRASTFLLVRIPLFSFNFRRKIALLGLFYGLKKRDLEEYFRRHYKERFIQSLTPLGNKVLMWKDSEAILLTGCTEIPAKEISLLFGFSEVVCTEFGYKNGKINRIKSDTFGNKKADFVYRRQGEKLIYYTDDLKSEGRLAEIMDVIINV